MSDILPIDKRSQTISYIFFGIAAMLASTSICYFLAFVALARFEIILATPAFVLWAVMICLTFLSALVGAFHRNRRIRE